MLFVPAAATTWNGSIVPFPLAFFQRPDWQEGLPTSSFYIGCATKLHLGVQIPRASTLVGISADRRVVRAILMEIEPGNEAVAPIS